MLEIVSKIVPWNVPNSYGEIIAKGAFEEFLKETPIVPMKVMHEGRPFGMWSDFEDRGDGLWAKGSIWLSAPREKVLPLMAKVPEVSISFRDMSPVRTFTRKRAMDFRMCGAPLPWDAQIVDQHVTRVAGLAEISIVDKGAFEGCRYTVL